MLFFFTGKTNELVGNESNILRIELGLCNQYINQHLLDLEQHITRYHFRRIIIYMFQTIIIL